MGGRQCIGRAGAYGASSINAMVYIRGNAYDYDHWSQLGNQGWSYESVLPYFKRAEDFPAMAMKNIVAGRPAQRAKINRENDELLDVFVEAGQTGIPFTKDFNGKAKRASRYEHTIRGSKRCSAARLFASGTEPQKPAHRN